MNLVNSRLPLCAHGTPLASLCNFIAFLIQFFEHRTLHTIESEVILFEIFNMRLSRDNLDDNSFDIGLEDVLL
jgi:hypothetical protein